MNLAQALIRYAQSGGQSVDDITQALSDRRRVPMQHATQAPVEVDRPYAVDDPGGDGGWSSGKLYQLPTRWKGSHVTSGLGWGTKTAADIMLAAGTALGAPEAGHVEYYHPTGAQGGGSIRFDPDASGPDYWIGHILGSAPVGRRLRRGQRLTSVSPKHAAPHAHVDRGG